MVAGINTTGVGSGAGAGQQILAALLRMAGGRRGNAPPAQPQQFDAATGEALVAAGLAPPPTPPVGAPSRPAGALAGNLLAPPPTGGGIGGSVPQQPPGPTPEEQAELLRNRHRGLYGYDQQAVRQSPQGNLLAMQ